ncbi:MAG: sel1 repeat family protein [Betaproteobacteria bacterium]|nr:sel1 repeat family protein [Betaproteobacteria bacterium]
MHPLFRTSLLAICLSTGVAAYAAERPLPNPILNPGTPWMFGGFSFEVPAEPGWLSYNRDGRSAALGKSVDEGKRIFGANVLAAALSEPVASAEDLSSQLREERLSMIDLRDFDIKVQEETGKQINGYLCSQYRIEADTKNDPKFPRLFMRGMTCANPGNARQLVDIAVSDLTNDKAMAESLVKVADALTSSLRFEPRIDKQGTEAVNKALGNNDIATALALLEPRAIAGDSRAAYLMADIYLSAKEHQDFARAHKWLAASAALGERDAIYQLGVVHERGIGVERNLPEAVKWFKLASDQRDAQAQLNLGILHDPRGKGIANAPEQAAQWFMLSANNGNKRAQGILDNHYKRKSEGGGESERKPQ